MCEVINLAPVLMPWNYVLKNEIAEAIKPHRSKDIVVWGAGQNGRMIVLLLCEMGIYPSCVYDAQHKGKLYGIDVEQEPDALSDNTLVLIAFNGPSHAVKRVEDLCESFDASYIHIVNQADGDRSTEGDVAFRPSRSLHDFAGIHEGKRCFVAGNGPSLNRVDMGRLKDEIVIGSNRCYIGFDKWGVRFPYWGVEDCEVGGWQASGWKQLRGTMKFVPEDMLFHCETSDPDVCPVPLKRINYTTTPPLFSVYPDVVFSGRSVTYMLLQLAVIMGCNPIYLIGVDFHFTTDGTDAEQDGAIWRQKKEDLNHFDPDYIPVGKFLAKPHWDRQRLAFQSAEHSSRLYGVDIFNATPDSHLDVFRKVDYSSLFI